MSPVHAEIAYLLDGRFYRMAWVEWGRPEAPVVVCVHGLSRNGRDFDVLAQKLAGQFRVICPDLPGRGQSEWLAQGAQYNPLSYVQALSHLLGHIGQPVLWVGTSLGGICGMLLAAAAGTPIAGMVLNDIGPFISQAALARIAEYLAVTPSFDDVAGLEAHLRRVHAPFGPLSDEEWAHLARHSGRVLPDGRVTLHYDPALTQPLAAGAAADVNLWPVWAAIACPMLVVRGASSDLLLADTAGQMAAKATIHEVADAGHAPALMDAPTIAVIEAFLTGQMHPAR